MKSAILFEYFLIVVLPPVILFGCSAGKENTRIKSMGNELSPLRHTLISEALRWEGVRYKYNGNDRRGIDCSGLVVRSFASANIPLPRTAAEQFLIGEKISLSHLIPGDLIFFKNTAGRGITHVASTSVIINSSMHQRVRVLFNLSLPRSIIKSTSPVLEEFYKNKPKGTDGYDRKKIIRSIYSVFVW